MWGGGGAVGEFGADVAGLVGLSGVDDDDGDGEGSGTGGGVVGF